MIGAAVSAKGGAETVYLSIVESGFGLEGVQLRIVGKGRSERIRDFHGDRKKYPADESAGYLVPRTGIEPARLAAHAPETCASTYSATWAWVRTLRGLRGAKVILFWKLPLFSAKKIDGLR